MLLNLLIKFVNLIISAVGILIDTLINILPPSPFNIIETLNIPYLEYLNWIVPISLFISILEVWLVAIGVYLVISVALRWAKVIE
mgnify:CR=1 FL=1